MKPEKCTSGDISYVKHSKTFHNQSGQGNPKFGKPSLGTQKTYWPNNNNNSSNIMRCFRCGKPHDPKTCVYAESTCFTCNKKGHLANVCRSSSNSKYRPSNKINLCESDSESESL